MKKIALLATALFLSSCAIDNTTTPDKKHLSAADKQQLINITQSLPAEHQARYVARNPVETLEFFGIRPGDVVLEALPGDGWYSKILMPYLGEKGRLIGVDYSLSMWPEFGGFATPEFIKKREQWPAQWRTDAKRWGSAQVDAYTFADLPADLTGQVDAVLFIRALHNLARFDAKGQYLQQALAETYRVLKPNGTVGVVQHAMSESKPDAWADGSRGYLKESDIVSAMLKAGFELVDSSDINKNPKDNPQENDNVWRLPPNLNGTDAQKQQNQLIGESNRVTLLFRKK
ncbi:methyltransferase [Cellvibrio mixtus]|uniref:Methyltransferase n=1 Tax=Cellvibrio mixtus TaxID=39650 RepID=A0A266QCR0_9GAMM|nr:MULTISPECIES: methyltransferase domain-containing protein [Cellvibrio]AQT60821.1 methyltransferase [Cellvibrio sp. PSBB023]OZY87139.1 methyltransferase [Cellvibrio mixtus]